MFGLLFSTLLMIVAEPLPSGLDYGEVYLEETASLDTPRFYLSSGYAGNISNSFLRMRSFVGNAQLRVWKYLSTGVFGHWIDAVYSSAGKQIRDLNEVSIVANVPKPEWGLFSHSQLQFMLGQWNVMNLFPLRVDLLAGGGGGMIQERNSFDAPSKNKFSYLWSVEQRFQFFDRFGAQVALFGHYGGIFLGGGITFCFR